jgi:gas vesicle protein
MDPREPTADDLARARADQEQHADDRVARRTEAWQEQAEQIENDMSDAVERAQAMGDRVEPSLLPSDRRGDETAAEDRD